MSLASPESAYYIYALVTAAAVSREARDTLPTIEEERAFAKEAVSYLTTFRVIQMPSNLTPRTSLARSCISTSPKTAAVLTALTSLPLESSIETITTGFRQAVATLPSGLVSPFDQTLALQRIIASYLDISTLPSTLQARCSLSSHVSLEKALVEAEAAELYLHQVSDRTVAWCQAFYMGFQVSYTPGEPVSTAERIKTASIEWVINDAREKWREAWKNLESAQRMVSTCQYCHSDVTNLLEYIKNV